MKVEIFYDRLKDLDDYPGVTLELPASELMIEDALNRAFIKNEDSYSIESWGHYALPHYVNELIHESEITYTLDELNLLAYKMKEMTSRQLMIFDAALATLERDSREQISSKSIINMVYNLDKFDFYPDITDDYDLGEVCLNGDLIESKKDIDDEVFSYIDAQKVGAAYREKENGIYNEFGYTFLSYELEDVYDGKLLPEKVDIPNRIIDLMITDSPSGEGTWHKIEFDNEVLKRGMFTKMIGASITLIPETKYQITDNCEIEKLMALQEKLQILDANHELSKFRAVLDFEKCYEDINETLDMIDNLDCYDFEPEFHSLGEYGKTDLQKRGVNINSPAFAGFRFSLYGESIMEQEQLCNTRYGAIKRNEIPFERNYSAEQEGIQMI